MANKTVYPYGTNGQLPSSIGLINDLFTGGVDKALAAEQGKVIGELLMESEEIELSTEYKYKYSIDSNNLWHYSQNDDARCCFIPINGNKLFRCTADGGTCHFAFLKSDTRSDGTTPDFADGHEERFYVYDGETKLFDIPSDANYLYVYAQLSNGTDITGRYQNFAFVSNRLDNIGSGGGGTLRTITPLFVYSNLSTSSGNHGEPHSTYRGIGSYVTPRFIAIAGKTIRLTTGKTGRYAVYEYGEDYGYLGYSYGDIVAQTPLELNLVYNSTKFIKLRFINSSEFDGNAKTTFTVEGIFPETWDVFNVRPGDNGYQRIAIPVRVTDPTCCDDETSTVQDASQILTDYGVICLPDKYSNIGRPTRLIIYCHGAAVNYSSSVTRFNAQDLDPTYWLAEGYAIMDIEGNPFNNTDEHMQTPQAMDCYVAAYKFAIEWYNIRRDGVFLGGRSMGGGMVFGIVRSQCPIPVIAACPNVPSAMCIGSSSNDRQQFFAEHCGFDIPAGFNWTTNYVNGDIETAGSKKKLFYDNWDKLVKNVPIWCMATDLPNDEENRKALVSNLYVESTDRKTLWGGLHIMARCPIKLFGCNQDETCPPPETSALYYRMLTNAGQIAELRLFNSYKDYSGTGTSAHHYDTQDPALRADITTSYGEELEDVPIVYIEMLAFWRRYEQGL